MQSGSYKCKAVVLNSASTAQMHVHSICDQSTGLAQIGLALLVPNMSTVNLAGMFEIL